VHLGLSRAAVDRRVRHSLCESEVDHCVGKEGDEGRKGLRRGGQGDGSVEGGGKESRKSRQERRKECREERRGHLGNRIKQ
jgi:hypothetical protein